MINQDNFQIIREWYEKYVAGFYTGDQEFDENIRMKEEHTERVCAVITDIGSSISLPDEPLVIAETIALLHDVGRYEQFAKYGTFVDLHSEDHALLSVKIIKRYAVLDAIEPPVKELILCGVTNHNKKEIPDSIDEDCLLYTRLIRDADKIDILKVITDYYANSARKRNKYMELGLPDTPEISDRVIADLSAGRFVHTTDLKTLNDFKLLQMGWVYDLHFRRTYRIFRERGYVRKLYEVLPHTPEIVTVYIKIEEFLTRQCAD